MSERKVIGKVTAYAAAVKGGYTGTYEDFCRDQANFASNAQGVANNLQQSKEVLKSAEAARDTAVESSERATQNATRIEESIGDATQAASNAADSATAAARSAEKAAESEATAERFATNASAAMGNTENFAKNAEQAAISANQALKNVVISANTAAENARQAETFAGSALRSATNAENAKTAAESAKSTAETAASDAQSAKSEAITSATNAAGSASAAETSATNAAASASAAAESAANAAGVLAGAEVKANKITAITAESTDEQYPSARAVWENESRLSESINETKEDIADITVAEKSVNIIKRDNKQGHIDENTGAFVKSASIFYHTLKIPLDKSKTNVLVKWKYNNSSAFGTVRCIAFYKEDGTVSNVIDNRQAKNSCFEIPDDAITFATDFGQDGYPFAYCSDDTVIDTSLYTEYYENVYINKDAMQPIEPEDTTFFGNGKIKPEYIPEAAGNTVTVTQNINTIYKTGNITTNAPSTGYTYGLIKTVEAQKKTLLVVFHSLKNFTRLGTIKEGGVLDKSNFYVLNDGGVKYTFVDINADDTWVIVLASGAGEMSADVSAYDCTGMPKNFETVKYFADTYKILPVEAANIINGINNSKWSGKNVLCIGDSLTHAGVWQTKLNTMLGMNVYTHAMGGSGMIGLIDGTTTSVGTLKPLSVDDVGGKDLIIYYAGYNDRGAVDGNVGDVYPAQNTIAGRLQYCINSIYELLLQANNLTCRVMIVTPHCAGKYSLIPYDGYAEYPAGSGRTLRTLASTIQIVAEYNSIPCYNAWVNSGINRFTWDVFSASPTAMNGNDVYDQLHLNTYVGYPHLGECIASFVGTN